jgi:hypothetical protein
MTKAKRRQPRISKARLEEMIPTLDLPLPTPPPDGAEWIEAYRQWRGGE